MSAPLLAVIFLALVAAGGVLLMWLCQQAPFSDDTEDTAQELTHLACKRCGKLLHYADKDCPRCHETRTRYYTAAEAVEAYERWHKWTLA